MLLSMYDFDGWGGWYDMPPTIVDDDYPYSFYMRHYREGAQDFMDGIWYAEVDMYENKLEVRVAPWAWLTPTERTAPQ